jgi:HK97 family phage prohead protease
MSTVEVAKVETVVRTFEVPLAESWDGRTLETRIVPYNQPATVADPPHFDPYEEVWMPKVFQRQLSTPGRDKVLMNVEHEEGIRGVVGQSLELAERDDGLYGSFGIHENSDGDKALTMIRNGFFTGVSLDARLLSSRRVDGIVQRVRAHLTHVSLCRWPAFADARVLALRTDNTDAGDEEPTPQPPPVLERSADVDERLAALGFEAVTRVATTEQAWDGSAARYTDEQYRAATLFCRPGDGPVKQRCSLPVLEPDGTLNVNALGAAAAALAGGRSPLADVTRADKAAAARKLIRYYNQAGKEPPAGLRAIAQSA